MQDTTVKNAPPLYGWVIAMGTGVVGFAVSLLLVDLGWMGSVFVGALVLLAVGTVFTVAENGGPGTGPNARVAPGSRPVSRPAQADAQASPSGASAAVAAAPVAAVQADTATRDTAGARPARLDAPRGGQGDSLQKITGLGPVLEGKLHELGIWHFDQIAALTADEVTWLDARLDAKGRMERDDWIAQAKALAAGTGAQT